MLKMLWGNHSQPNDSRRKKQIRNSLLAFIGYLLSPLSWWNDAIINVPLAYIFSVPFALLDQRFFIAAFSIGYGLSNLIGFLLLHKGVAGLIEKQPKAWSFWHSIVITIIYTAAIILMVHLGWIPEPRKLVADFL